MYSLKSYQTILIQLVIMIMDFKAFEFGVQNCAFLITEHKHRTIFYNVKRPDLPDANSTDVFIFRMKWRRTWPNTFHETDTVHSEQREIMTFHSLNFRGCILSISVFSYIQFISHNQISQNHENT